MIIEYGDLNNPTGNAVIFWKIKGNTKLLKKAEIIASNFVVSPLQSNEETLMVNFPPVLIDNHEKLLRIAEANNIDLIRGGEIYVPEDITDFSGFYKKQIEKYNGIIREYLLAYKEKNNTVGETDPSDEAAPVTTELPNLPQLLGQAGEILASIRTLVKRGGNEKLIGIKLKRLEQIQTMLDGEMPGFDFKKIIGYADRSNDVVDDLVDLYTRKLFAVFLEDYETAENLRKEIGVLEKIHRL